MIIVMYDVYFKNRGTYRDDRIFGVFETPDKAIEVIKERHVGKRINEYEYYFYNLKENGRVDKQSFTNLITIT